MRGLPLRTLGEDPDPPPFDVGAEVLRAAKEEEKTLGGAPLAAMRPTEVSRKQEISLAVFYALQLKPELQESDDRHRLQN